MFNFKKCLATLLAGVCTLSTTSVFATNGSKFLYDENNNKKIVDEVPASTANISIATKNKKDTFTKGENFEVSFKINKNYGFAMYDFKVEYDGTVIAPVSLAAVIINSLSIGFIVDIFITLAFIPSDFNAS